LTLRVAGAAATAPRKTIEISLQAIVFVRFVRGASKIGDEGDGDHDDGAAYAALDEGRDRYRRDPNPLQGAWS